MTVVLALLLIDGLLLTSAVLLESRSEVAAVSVVGVTAVIAFWQIALFSCLNSPSQVLKIHRKIRRPHVVQASLQFCIYVYWALYWDAPARQALLIFTQIVFAYALEIMSSLTRRREWNAGFGPVPIVFSINLFIWFRDDYFYCQLGMIAVTYLAKELLTWNRDGVRRHIFNPSAFSLAVAAVALMLSGMTDQMTTGVDLVESFELPPNFYELIFLLGLVVQVLFATTPITLGAVIANFSLFFAVSWAMGGRAGSFPIDRSVFLAMTLLIPDPATTPRSVQGKFVFGLIYGASILATALALKYYQQPDYFNKILIIPVLNLLVPLFDKLPAWNISSAMSLQWLTSRRARLAWTASYALLFIAIIGSLKQPRTTPLGREWLVPVARSSPEMSYLIVKMIYCRQVFPDVYGPFGFRNELREYDSIRDVFDGELTLNDLETAFQDHQPL